MRISDSRKFSFEMTIPNVRSVNSLRYFSKHLTYSFNLIILITLLETHYNCYRYRRNYSRIVRNKQYNYANCTLQLCDETSKTNDILIDDLTSYRKTSLCDSASGCCAGRAHMTELRAANGKCLNSSEFLFIRWRKRAELRIALCCGAKYRR